MSKHKAWIAIAAAAALAGSLAVGTGVARAGDAPQGAPQGMPEMQKPIADQPLVKAMVGSWTTESKGMMGNGKGKVTFALGVSGTALLETYENAGGMMGTYTGHAVMRLSADRKTAKIWWFDVMNNEPLELTGPITDTGYDVKGEMKDGQGSMRITFEKKGDGYEFHGYGGADNQEWMAEVYTRAK